MSLLCEYSITTFVSRLISCTSWFIFSNVMTDNFENFFFFENVLLRRD